jgi:predicted nucleotidyltransferase
MNVTTDKRSVHKRTLSRDEIIAHIRNKLLAARDDVVGIVLFGSFARGEAWHDIDVLVVLRERIPTRKAWATIMRQCQDAIGLYNLDLIPTHLGGLRQGLAEHVFILMDVAFDGLVIYGGGTNRAAAARGPRGNPRAWHSPHRHRWLAVPSQISPEYTAIAGDH